MAVDFSIQGVIDIIAQTLCAGDTTIAGLLIMVGVFFVSLTILAMVRAPVTYSLVPMIPLAIIFASMGVMSLDISFIIIIVTVLIIAREAVKITSGRD